MKLTADNRAFLKEHGLTINSAISLLIDQENDARENGGTIFPDEFCGKSKDKPKEEK